jgi:hypothetical protein
MNANRQPLLVPTAQPRGQRCWWLYMVGLTGGRVKVGRTIDPRARFGVHRYRYGPLQWSHVFAPVPSMAASYMVEEYAIKLLAGIGGRIGRTEVFSGIEKVDAVRVGREAMRLYGERWHNVGHLLKAA